MKQLLITIAAVVLVGCGFGVNKLLWYQLILLPEPKHQTSQFTKLLLMKTLQPLKQHIDVGTDVNAKDTYGSTPLTSAVIGGRKEIVEILIDKGADVNGKDHIEWSPLSHAVVEGHKETVELLIAKGADVNLFNTINLVNTKDVRQNGTRSC